MARTAWLDVVAEYVLTESAWNGKHRATLNQAMQSARLGEYDVLLTWALDRLSREGVEATTRVHPPELPSAPRASRLAARAMDGHRRPALAELLSPIFA